MLWGLAETYGPSQANGYSNKFWGWGGAHPYHTPYHAPITPPITPLSHPLLHMGGCLCTASHADPPSSDEDVDHRARLEHVVGSEIQYKVMNSMVLLGAIPCAAPPL